MKICDSYVSVVLHLTFGSQGWSLRATDHGGSKLRGEQQGIGKPLGLPVDVKTSSHPFFRGELENTSINYIMAENQWVFLGWFHPYINYGVMGHCFGSVWISFKTLNWNWRNFWDALDKIAISSPNNSEVSGPSLWIHQRLVNDVKAIMP